MVESLQDQFGSKGICFGCGPLNPMGLKIKSFVADEEVIAKWRPKAGHEGFKGMMNGGIIAALLDCHSNWAAAWFLMKDKGLERPLSTVTGKFEIKFLAPTPMDASLLLTAKLQGIFENRAVIRASLLYENVPTANFEGTFLIVKPDHPAYNQWG
jgi:acyl-coenzyme A thioesterase PaaI-like protein